MNAKFLVQLISAIVVTAVLILGFSVLAVGYHYVRSGEKDTFDMTTTIDWVDSPENGISDPETAAIYEEGKQLFKARCATCHHKNMIDHLTGPALGEAEEKWSPYPREDLYQWIRNSQRLIDHKHPRALALWKEWNQTVMSPNNDLSDEKIESILTYTRMQ